MEVNSSGEVLSIEDRVVQIAFDLTGSEPAYVIISTPESGGDEDEFFGHSHYVELKDQIFGRYGGISRIAVPTDDRVELNLAFDVPEIGKALTIRTRQPMAAEILSQLRSLRLR